MVSRSRRAASLTFLKDLHDMHDPTNLTLPILGQNEGMKDSACSKEDESLIKDGWERRFIADERMAGDSETMYRELGYEVKRIPFDSGTMPDSCNGCEIVLKKFCVLYTRKRSV